MGWPGLGLSDPRHTHNVHIPAGVGGLDRIIAHIVVKWKDFSSKLLHMESGDARIRIERH
jgi:hypothetical protein